jgi:ribonuclease HI
MRRMADELKKVSIYTDGACDPNPGPGGYGVVLICDGYHKELSGGYQKTTNNRMEIMAVIVGLRALKQRCRVTVFSDSQYLVRAMNDGWAKRWQRQGWMKSRKAPAASPDLWRTLLELCEQHIVAFEWVRGHAGNANNERCDQLATTAAKLPSLPPDVGYGQNFERERGTDIFDFLEA